MSSSHPIAIYNPGMVILVIEDVYDYYEHREAFDPVQQSIPSVDCRNSRVVVGVTILTMRADPGRHGHFMPDGMTLFGYSLGY